MSHNLMIRLLFGMLYLVFFAGKPVQASCWSQPEPTIVYNDDGTITYSVVTEGQVTTELQMHWSPTAPEWVTCNGEDIALQEFEGEEIYWIDCFSGGTTSWEVVAYPETLELYSVSLYGEEADYDGDGYSNCEADCAERDTAIHPGAAEVCDGVDNDCNQKIDYGAYTDTVGKNTSTSTAGYYYGNYYQPATSVELTKVEAWLGGDSKGTVSLSVAVWRKGGDGKYSVYAGPFSATSTDYGKTFYGVPTTVYLVAGDTYFIGVQTYEPIYYGSVTTPLSVSFGTVLGKSSTANINAQPLSVTTGSLYYQRLSSGTKDEDGDGDGYSSQCGDCSSVDETIFPGAVEQCDDQDNDCDGTIDEGVDQDQDGDGITPCNGDCDDVNPLIYPDATETCDAVDNNCNKTVDEGFDQDNDGYASCGITVDCNDRDAAIYPGAPEVCDGIDQNCDGDVASELDVDGDGYSCADDCDETNTAINVEAVEVCNDFDDNCDEQIDEGFDQDNDGYFDQSACSGVSLDCNDLDALIYPGADEVCDDFVDNNCDGIVNEGCEGSYANHLEP